MHLKFFNSFSRLSKGFTRRVPEGTRTLPMGIQKLPGQSSDSALRGKFAEGIYKASLGFLWV